MPLNGHTDVIKAINAIENGDRYAIWMLRILYCNGDVSKAFRKADCWTVAYHDYKEIIKKKYGQGQGQGDENLKVTLEDKAKYYGECKEIRNKIKALDDKLKKLKNNMAAEAERRKCTEQLSEFIGQIHIPRVHGICTLFDITDIKSISANLEEEERRRVDREIRETWSTESSKKIAIGLLHDFISRARFDGTVLWSAHPIVEFGKRKRLTEAQWCKMIVIHILQPLTDCEIYVDAHYFDHEETCPCGCDTKIKYGDTSIGNKKVWHGSPDILMLTGHVGVSFAELSMGEKKKKCDETLEVKNPEDDNNAIITKRVLDTDTRSQCLAQSITFGCCKHRTTPSLVPHILINGTDIHIFMYDWNYDILLESRNLSLIDNDSLDFNSILVLWLCLHWTLFSTGPTTHMYDANFPSGFKAMAKEKDVFDVYRNDMLISLAAKASYVHNQLDFPIHVERRDESDVQPLLKRQASANSDDGQDNKHKRQETPGLSDHAVSASSSN